MFQAINTVALLLIPVLYFYALQTIPSERDFDGTNWIESFFILFDVFIRVHWVNIETYC